MKLLAIETATEACSVALLIDDELSESFVVEPRRHTELVLPMVQTLLADAGLSLSGLDAIAFGRGPGAFTGVRIGIGVVQGLAFGADLPVVPVSTLAALAQGVLRRLGHERVLAALDARMGEVYWGAFAVEQGLMRAVSRERVVAPGEVPLPEGADWFGAGSGWETYRAVLTKRLGPALVGEDAVALPHARDVATLAAADFAAGRAVPAESALPVYLRDEVAKKA